MPDSSQPHLKRLFAEAVVVIGSILLAFAIDAWWNDLQSDRSAREVLAVVHSNMEVNVGSLTTSILKHEEIVAAIGEVLKDSSSPELEEALIAVEIFEPDTAALDTLFAAGLIGDIDDTELQISLGAFSKLAKDLHEREARAAGFRDAARRRVAELGVPIWDLESQSQILEDTHFLNLLVMRRTEERGAIESGHILKGHITDLLEQLGSSL